MPKLDRFSRNRMMGSIIIMALIVVAFFWFMRANEARVIDTNAVYAESTTQQTAVRINDLFQSAEDAIHTFAGIYQTDKTENAACPKIVCSILWVIVMRLVRYLVEGTVLSTPQMPTSIKRACRGTRASPFQG